VEVVVEAAAGFARAVVVDDGKISESMPAVVGVVVARRVGSDADVQEVASRMNKHTNTRGLVILPQAYASGRVRKNSHATLPPQQTQPNQQRRSPSMCHIVRTPMVLLDRHGGVRELPDTEQNGVLTRRPAGGREN
jgi:hypothetical protein